MSIFGPWGAGRGFRDGGIAAAVLENPGPEHRHVFGEELIATAGAFSVVLARDASIEELVTLVEFFGLVRHNLELIKHRRIINKIEDKIEKK